MLYHTLYVAQEGVIARYYSSYTQLPCLLRAATATNTAGREAVMMTTWRRLLSTDRDKLGGGTCDIPKCREAKLVCSQVIENNGVVHVNRLVLWATSLVPRNSQQSSIRVHLVAPAAVVTWYPYIDCDGGAGFEYQPLAICAVVYLHRRGGFYTAWGWLLWWLFVLIGIIPLPRMVFPLCWKQLILWKMTASTRALRLVINMIKTKFSRTFIPSKKNGTVRAGPA